MSLGSCSDYETVNEDPNADTASRVSKQKANFKTKTKSSGNNRRQIKQESKKANMRDTRRG